MVSKDDVNKEEFKAYKVIRKSGVLKMMDKKNVVDLSNALVWESSEFHPHNSIDEDTLEVCISNFDYLDDRFDYDESEIQELAEKLRDSMEK